MTRRFGPECVCEAGGPIRPREKERGGQDVPVLNRSGIRGGERFMETCPILPVDPAN